MTWGVDLKGSIDFTFLENTLDKDLMMKIGLAATGIIQEETQEKYRDENGRPFKAYSKDYAQWRLEELERSPSQIDLTVTGDMLNSMQVLEGATTKTSVTIGFINKQKARGGLLASQKMERTNKKRPWFGFGARGSKRRRRIQQVGAELYIEALTRQ
jgi:hypothetical protein